MQSLIALGTGGFHGLGIGNGRQKLFFLPEPHTDFIFSIIGEELGFVGAIALIGALRVPGVARLPRRALQRRSASTFYAALGFTLMIARAGADQRQRRALPPADEGTAAAAGELRRLVADREPDRGRDAAESCRNNRVDDEWVRWA